ncbi:MAG: 50S ribosomal protein L20 [Proteobacteria bacterium]|nr:50S ribosomal protein L20 [Pseudomonadota bacterium]
MPRAKRGFKGRRRHKKVLKQAKGYFGSRNRLIRTAMEAVDHALKYAYVGRKLKKRDFRSLWQTRIQAGARVAGTSYSRLMGDLKRRDVGLNRKMLAELARSHPEDFQVLVNMAGEL